MQNILNLLLFNEFKLQTSLLAGDRLPVVHGQAGSGGLSGPALILCLLRHVEMGERRADHECRHLLDCNWSEGGNFKTLGDVIDTGHWFLDFVIKLIANIVFDVSAQCRHFYNVSKVVVIGGPDG